MKMLLMVVALWCTLAVADATLADKLEWYDIDVFVKEHNRVRAAVNVGTVTWNQTLSDYAAARGTQCQYQVSQGPYGENLYSSFDYTNDIAWTAAISVKAWEAEKVHVDLPDWTCVSSENNNCKHYSQVVWNETKSVGCAIFHCVSIGIYVVCEYSPSGNIAGKIPY